MDELIFTQVYADMAGGVGRFEKNEIANTHAIVCYWPALPDLLFCGAWKVYVENVSVNHPDESRAIDALAIIASQTVSRAQPAVVFPLEHVFDGRFACPGGLIPGRAGITGTVAVVRRWPGMLAIGYDARRWIGRRQGFVG